MNGDEDGIDTLFLFLISILGWSTERSLCKFNVKNGFKILIDTLYSTINFVNERKLRLLGKYQVKIVLNADEVVYALSSVIGR